MVTVPALQNQPQPLRSPRGRNLSNLAAASGEPQARAAKATSEALQGISQLAMNAHEKRQERQDAVERARDVGAARIRFREAFINEQTQGSNFAERDALNTFNQSLDETIQETLENHKGSNDSGMALHEMLVRERTRFQDTAILKSIESSQALVQRQFSDSVNQLADTAFNAPDTIESLFAESEEIITNYANALTSEQQEAMSRVAKSRIAHSVIDSFLASGDTDSARELLSRGTDFLDPDEQRKVRLRITVQEVEGAKKNAEVAGLLKRLRDAGITITPQIALAAEGINLPAVSSRQTLADKIQELEEVRRASGAQNWQATPDEITKLSGALIEEKKADGVFGGGATGRSAALVASLAPDFASGNTTPEDDRFFLEAATMLARPDRITGQPGALSPTVREALKQRGFDPRDIGRQPVPGISRDDPNAARGMLEPGAPEAVPDLSQGLPDPDGAIANVVGDLGQHQQEVQPLEEQGGMLAPEAPAPRANVFDMAALVTGPISGATQTLSGIAGVGQFLRAPQTRQARAFVKGFERDVVRVLQNNPRFAVAERQDILKEVTALEGSFLQDPQAWRDDLIGFDNFLAERLRNAQETLESGTVSREEMQHTLNVFNGLQKAREILGVPPLMPSRSSVDKAIEEGVLKSGDKFRTTDGRVLRIP